MTSQEENVTAIVTVDDICNHHLYAAVKCMNIVIDREIPAEPSDVAYIMEVMTKVGKFQKFDKDGKCNDKMLFKLRLDEKSAACIWHCLNIVLANNLVTDQGQQVFISQLQSKLAIKLDQILAMKSSPEELQSTPAPLHLVPE